METAAIYARVSTDEQFKHGISIDAQVARCRQYTDMLGLASVEIACEGQSANTTSRFSLEFGIWLPNTFWGGKLWVE